MSSERWKLLAILAIAVIALALAGLIAFQMLRGEPRYPWLFKGAYGVYEGKALILFIPVMTIKYRVEVLDFNSTHVKVLYHTSVEGFGVNSTVEWVKLDEELGYPAELVKGLGHPIELVKVEEKDYYIEGIGTRLCIIKTYKEKNGEMVLYIDKATGWILQIEFKGEGAGITLTLKETNIPGLKELIKSSG